MKPERIAAFLSAASRLEIDWRYGKRWQAVMPGIIATTNDTGASHVLFGTPSETVLSHVNNLGFDVHPLSAWYFDYYQDLYLTRYGFWAKDDELVNHATAGSRLLQSRMTSVAHILDRLPSIGAIVDETKSEPLPGGLRDVFQPTALRFVPLDRANVTGPCVVRYYETGRFALCDDGPRVGRFLEPTLALAAACSTATRAIDDDGKLRFAPWRYMRFMPPPYRRLLYLSGASEPVEGIIEDFPRDFFSDFTSLLDVTLS